MVLDMRVTLITLFLLEKFVLVIQGWKTLAVVLGVRHTINSHYKTNLKNVYLYNNSIFNTMDEAKEISRR